MGHIAGSDNLDCASVDLFSNSAQEVAISAILIADGLNEPEASVKA